MVSPTKRLAARARSRVVRGENRERGRRADDRRGTPSASARTTVQTHASGRRRGREPRADDAADRAQATNDRRRTESNGGATRRSVVVRVRSRPRPRPRGAFAARTSRRDVAVSKHGDGSRRRARSRSSLRARSRSSLDPLTRVAANTETCASLVPLARVDSAARTRHAPAARRSSSPSRRGTRDASSDSPHCAAAIAAHVERVGEEDASGWTSTRRDTRSIAAECARKSLVASRCRPRDGAPRRLVRRREADSRTADSRVGSCPESSFARVAAPREDRRGAFEMPRLERRCRRRHRTSRTMRRRSARRTRRRRRATTRRRRSRGDASNAHARGDASNAHATSPSAPHRRRSIATTTRSKGQPFERRSGGAFAEGSSSPQSSTTKDPPRTARRYPPNARDARRASSSRASSSRRRFVDGGHETCDGVHVDVERETVTLVRAFARVVAFLEDDAARESLESKQRRRLGPSTSRRTRRRTALAFDESRRRRTRRARFSSRA